MNSLPLSQLCSKLEVTFSDLTLLKAAFTHSSFRNEHKREHMKDNERLEFLGDAVLELCVSQYLFQALPDAPEGELTRMRSTIVCESSLVAAARNLDFPRYLRLGKGEELSGGRERPSLVADVFEAFIGALFLDQGLHVVEQFMTRHFYPRIEIVGERLHRDYKTMLQEYVQKQNLGVLMYDIIAERGPAHDREFVAQVMVGGTLWGEGVGHSKKEAEQNAARKALHR
ncbi:ribonuclease III [Sulfoacidibacillus ferrooxidans]|uniref:Ribonuclease 3 n=1 Tax=Sulfoacidibacillus ferrooxidans TaxID=2005001 RepID=A0A9X1V9K4_9BACL|nr:Ribonuclease 3 [Sulfoacidibacillus ferrooxidans]